jgi:hypothetical protein
MRKALISVSVLALCSVGLFAQDDLPQYQTAMKAAAGASRAVRAAVTAKDDAAIKEQAKIMADNFDAMGVILAKHQKDDAVKIAMTAKDAAKSLGSASSPEDQTAAMQKIGGTCMACHAIARDGSNFK